jgi:hypothetical protein
MAPMALDYVGATRLQMCCQCDAFILSFLPVRHHYNTLNIRLQDGSTFILFDPLISYHLDEE